MSDETFDWNLRPLFLRLGEGESPENRAAAFAELCGLIGVDPAAIPEQGNGRGVELTRGKRSKP